MDRLYFISPHVGEAPAFQGQHHRCHVVARYAETQGPWLNHLDSILRNLPEEPSLLENLEDEWSRPAVLVQPDHHEGLAVAAQSRCSHPLRASAGVGYCRAPNCESGPAGPLEQRRVAATVPRASLGLARTTEVLVNHRFEENVNRLGPPSSLERLHARAHDPSHLAPLPSAVRQAEFFIRTERCGERSPRLANLEYVMRARISPVRHNCAEIDV
jgi:hypothetical protein